MKRVTVLFLPCRRDKTTSALHSTCSTFQPAGSFVVPSKPRGPFCHPPARTGMTLPSTAPHRRGRAPAWTAVGKLLATGNWWIARHAGVCFAKILFIYVFLSLLGCTNWDRNSTQSHRQLFSC